MTMEAVRTNKSLLTFPQIFTLDLYVSSLLVVWVTEVVVLGIYVLILTLAGYQFQLYAPMILWAALAGIGFFAFAVGLVLSIAALFFPVVENLVRMAMRVLFFTSGVFFSPTQLAGRFGDIVMWNPILNFIELGRSAFITRMPAAHIKIFYITCLTVGLLALGLLLERHVRSRQAA